MQAHHLRAPSADGSVLAEPPLAEAPALLSANAALLNDWDEDFQGRPASWLRATTRTQVLERARSFLAEHGLASSIPENASADRLVVTGHQPELFHPGVWVKNFAAAAIARESNALALNLIVDNDIPKSSTVRVPHAEGDSIRIERVEFDGRAGETPYEDLDVVDEDLFASFAPRARAALGGQPADPVLDLFWPNALRFKAQTRKLGLRFALARRAVEAAWGVNNLEIPLSTVCETEGFLWFASHLLAHLPRFQDVHNDALARYRTLYGIRSKNHPVPALGRQGDWLEAPFWAWRSGEPRRRPLFARQRARTLELRIGGDDAPMLELPLSPDREACCAVEQLQTLPGRGVRLRTRALTTTMFARRLLGDLFLHGIGGAKYDELGDEISNRFYAGPAPGYLTLSMTLWLGLNADPAVSGRLASVDRQARDLTWNPDRHLAPSNLADPGTRHWVERKLVAIAGPISSHAQRLERFHEIRRCNEALQQLMTDQRASLSQDHDRLIGLVKRDTLARSREYALILHSRRRLREALGNSLPGLRLGDD